MKLLNKILSILITNAIGYYGSLALLAFLVLKLDVLNYETTTIDKAHFEQIYFLRTQISWGVCAVFSLFSFLFKSSLRFVFLLLPIFVPILFGLFTILTAS